MQASVLSPYRKAHNTHPQAGINRDVNSETKSRLLEAGCQTCKLQLFLLSMSKAKHMPQTSTAKSDKISVLSHQTSFQHL